MAQLVPLPPLETPVRRVLPGGPPPPSDAAPRRNCHSVPRPPPVLDSSFEIPGTKFRVGLDPIVGLIPVVGDLIGMLISGYIIMLAARLGVPRAVLGRMLINVAADTVLGAVPVAGDVLDAAWRANLM